MLRRLSPDQVRLAGELGARPTGAIAADNNRRLRNCIVSATPFAALPPRVQADVRAALARIDASVFSLPDAPPDLARTQVALVANGSALTLGVIPPDARDIWLSPVDEVDRSGIAGVDTPDNMDPEVIDALGQSPPVNHYEMPGKLWNQTVRFPPELSRTDLPELLESLEKQTSIPFVSDDFLRSGQAPPLWLPPDRVEIPLGAALEAMARGFGHRFVYHKGTMRVQTLTPGLDRRAEPPPEIADRLRQLDSRKRPPELADYLALSRLSDLQLLTISTHHVPGETQYGLRGDGYQLRDVLRLYDSLDGQQKGLVETVAGLPADRMNPQQRARFDALTSTGLAQIPRPAETRPAEGLYAQRQVAQGKQVAFTLQVVAVGHAVPQVQTYRLSLR
jgi:hypothetical protein